MMDGLGMAIEAGSNDSSAAEPAQGAWYLVQCKPREDQRAVDNLRNQGFESFAPLCVAERMRNRRIVKKIEPMFPGYAFVSLNRIDHDWGVLRSTRGVSRLVRFGLHFPIVPRGIVENLRSRVDKPIELKSHLAEVKPGERVKIIDGPYVNVDAIFQKLDGNERVLVLIELMQRQLPVLVPAESVVAL